MANRIKTIRPLVIGIGVAGKRHLEAQLALGNQTGIFTTNKQTAATLKQNKNIIVFENLDDGMDWANLVHVCTPDDKHTKFVAKALKRGKAVLCEKALTTNLADALYLQRLAHQYGSTLLIGQNYRLTPTFLETKKRVRTGKLGSLIEIKATYLHDKTQYQQRVPLRKNADFLYIGGSHAVDLALWISRERVLSVKASSKQTKSNYPNSYRAVLQFTSGLLGHILLDASKSQPINGTELVIVGTQGKLISHNKKDHLTSYKRGGLKPQIVKLSNNLTRTVALEVKILNDYLTGQAGTYVPLPKIDEAVETIKILDAIQRAAFLNQEIFL